MMQLFLVLYYICPPPLNFYQSETASGPLPGSSSSSKEGSRKSANRKNNPTHNTSSTEEWSNTSSNGERSTSASPDDRITSASPDDKGRHQEAPASSEGTCV